MAARTSSRIGTGSGSVCSSSASACSGGNSRGSSWPRAAAASDGAAFGGGSGGGGGGCRMAQHRQQQFREGGGDDDDWSCAAAGARGESGDDGRRCQWSHQHLHPHPYLEHRGRQRLPTTHHEPPSPRRRKGPGPMSYGGAYGSLCEESDPSGRLRRTRTDWSGAGDCCGNGSLPRRSQQHCSATADAMPASSPSASTSTSPRSVVALSACGEGSAPQPHPFDVDPPFGDEPRRNDDDDNNGNSSDRGPIEIEIEPGLYSSLRGSDETWEAILEDMYMPSPCPWCQTTVFAIQDCGYVLCPECKAVFPAEDGGPGSSGMINRVASGVGLGFTFESLLKWQPDVNECRRQRLLERD